MTLNFKRSSILVSLVGLAIVVGMMAFWPSLSMQKVEAAKCIADPAGGTFNVALNSVIRDGQLVVDESLAETQPPLHWKYPAIRLSWTAAPSATGYFLRRHDTKSPAGTEYYATKANEAETMLTTTTAVRPNHASARRDWYVDVVTTNGEGETILIDGSSVYSVEMNCGIPKPAQNGYMTVELLTESVGSDPAPDELPYPSGKFINHPDWNPHVESILAARRAAATSTPVVPPTSTPVPPTPTPTQVVPPTPIPSTPTPVPPTPTPVPPTPIPPTPIPPTPIPPTPAPVPSLTAEIRNVPSSHDGSTPFSAELHFSENVPNLSYKTLRDSAFQITNARINGVRRLVGGSNQSWLIILEPTGNEIITITLPPTTNCTATGAICTPDDTKLSNRLLRQVPFTQIQPENTPSLTAKFRNAPSTHNGTSEFTIELHFSEHIPGLSYRTVRDSALRITNGQITRARRYVGGSNQGWRITIQPTSQQTIEVKLPPTTSCTAAGAICLPNGAKVSSTLLTQIPYE